VLPASLVRTPLEGALGSPVPMALLATTLNSYSTQGFRSTAIADSMAPVTGSGSGTHTHAHTHTQTHTHTHTHTYTHTHTHTPCYRPPAHIDGQLTPTLALPSCQLEDGRKWRDSHLYNRSGLFSKTEFDSVGYYLLPRQLTVHLFRERYKIPACRIEFFFFSCPYTKLFNFI